MRIAKAGNFKQDGVYERFEMYGETVMPKVVELSLAQPEVQLTREELLGEIGKYFVEHVLRFGYDRILRVLGRNLRDFLIELDNLHE